MAKPNSALQTTLWNEWTPNGATILELKFAHLAELNLLILLSVPELNLLLKQNCKLSILFSSWTELCLSSRAEKFPSSAVPELNFAPLAELKTVYFLHFLNWTSFLCQNWNQPSSPVSELNLWVSDILYACWPKCSCKKLLFVAAAELCFLMSTLLTLHCSLIIIS